MYISGLDQHPTQDHETKTATVKIPDWQREISIHKCPPQEDGESFYNYLLVPAPADQAAYCAGEGEPCPDGLMFNGIECVDYFPILKGPPIFSGPHTTGNNAEMQVYFKCQVQYDRVPDDNAARFMITFIFDGLELESIEPPHRQLPPFIVGPDGDLSANLTEYYLQGRLGKEIQCKVRSFWLEDGEKGTAMISVGKYKATLEAVEIFDFDMTNGDVQRIPFHPTLPFTYFHCAAGGCPLPFAYFFILNTDVATDMDCSLIWNGLTPELAVNIKPFSGSRTFEVKFEPYTGDHFQQYYSLWHKFIIPTVMIRAFHSSEKLCRSISGGHIATLDGLDFNSFVAGDYNLVLGEAAQYRLEVQVRQESCNGNVACNCGVIVREVNSAVKVGYNECGEWDSTTARQISVTRLLAQQPDDGTEINNDDIGRKFSIRMPSGTRVEVDATVPWFNVAVHLAPIYHGNTSVSSLCGNSNGNPNDDTNDASISRIVDPAKSYFNVQPDCYAEFLPPAISCFCSDSGTVECTDTEQDIIPKSPANTVLSTIWSSGVICIAPGSSFLHKHSRERNLLLSWPTPKGKTESEAAKYCSDILAGSPVFNDCGTVVKTDLIILQCVKDIQIADEYIATTSYASSFVQECLNNLIAQENNSTGGSASPAFDISAIYSKICPAQCSGHGTCTNATCICNGGFIGADCSIDETQPPVLTGIARSGICNIQHRPCSTVSVFGHGVTSSKTLKCRFVTMGGGPALDTIGTLITDGEVSCAAPKSTVITSERPAILRQGISVANDGVLFSNVLEFLTFDSVCATCGQNKICTIKTDSCLISDRCYANGTMKDAHTCQQCSPRQSISSWTDMPVIETLLPCSRTCDYGAQIKQTVCSINNAVIKTEAVLCQTTSCTASPEENLQGVILTFSNKNTINMLLTPTDILSHISQTVNSYCFAHATQCCDSVGIPNGVSLSSFASLESCTYGSGYPQVGDVTSRIKVIVKIIRSEVQSKCLQVAVDDSSTVFEKEYADPNIIINAVTEGKDVIERALNVTIESVEKHNG